MELFGIAHSMCVGRLLPLRIWLSFASHLWPPHDEWGEYEAQILSLVFESRKFMLKIHCLFCAGINFLYLYRPLKIQMLVTSVVGNSDGCIATNFLKFCHSLWCSTLHCVKPFTECLHWWQNPFLCSDCFWAQAPWKEMKSPCVLGWPLAVLTGWAEVEDVFANRYFFRINVLFLAYQNNHWVFIKASLCK